MFGSRMGTIEHEPRTMRTFVSTLLHTWGGDTPPEAFWALKDFVLWMNNRYGCDAVAPDEDDYYSSDDWDGDIFSAKLERMLKTIEEAQDGV